MTAKKKKKVYLTEKDLSFILTHIHTSHDSLYNKIQHVDNRLTSLEKKVKL